MEFGSFCSGIGAPEIAWSAMGWRPLFFSEIEPFPSAVLAARFPNVPNLGDMTKITDEQFKKFKPDVVVAGTPCQSFSVAGLRGGMADPRGNLALVFLRLVDRLRPRWVVWENVPGILSSNDGRDFGSFLGALGQLGYGFAYRILDAQYAGVPQRRRRVFVVGCTGDWRRAAAVLFERHSLSGNPAPSHETGERVAPTISARTKGSGGLRTDFDCDGGLIASTGNISHCLNAGAMGRLDYESETFITRMIQNYAGTQKTDARTILQRLRGKVGEEAFTEWGLGILDSLQSQKVLRQEVLRDGEQRTEKACIEMVGGSSPGKENLPTRTMLEMREAGRKRRASQKWRLERSDADQLRTYLSRLSQSEAPDAEALFDLWEAAKGIGILRSALSEIQEIRRCSLFEDKPTHVHFSVRRLTPLEAERLQGFPDGHTDIQFRGKKAADGPRYKSIGNAMAVPVLRWIGQRIEAVDKIK